MVSRTRELISIARATRQTALNKDYLTLEDSWLKTIEKAEIIDNRIELPSKSFGDILLNKALIFASKDSYIIELEATCRISDDYLYVVFDAADALSGQFATFSYMTIKGLLND